MEFSPFSKFPIFDGSNYAYWKARMKSELKSIDERVWMSVVNGWSPPTYLVENERVIKPVDRWTENEFKLANFNSRGLNALFSAVTPDEFQRIMTCETAKETWDISQLTHEGTSVVKAPKFQNLATQFETIKMNEKETFDEFYARLSDIVNSYFNLGENIPDNRVVKKILRSLPDRFIPKVTVLNSLPTLASTKLEELVGDLQTYELDMFPSKTEKKIEKGVALKARKEVKQVLESDSESESEDMALFARKFRKFLKLTKINLKMILRNLILLNMIKARRFLKPKRSLNLVMTI